MILRGKREYMILRGKEGIHDFKGKEGIHDFKGKEGTHDFKGKEGIHKTALKVQIPYTLASHGTTGRFPREGHLTLPVRRDCQNTATVDPLQYTLLCCTLCNCIPYYPACACAKRG